MRAVCSQFFHSVSRFTRMSAMLAAILVAALLPHPVAAQDGPQAEIGTSIGVTIIRAFGETETHVGIPAGVGPLSIVSPVMYATFFATPSVMVEPQVSLSSVSGGGSTTTFFTIAAQVGYLFQPGESGSPYVAANGAFQRTSGDGSSISGPGVGGEVGYRLTARSSLGIRISGRYRRWFSDFKDYNEFGFGIGLGAIL